MGDLEAALGLAPELDAQLDVLIDQLVGVARQLASGAIQLAIAEGGNSIVIDEAQAFLSIGDELRDALAPKDAAAKYKDALATADSA